MLPPLKNPGLDFAFKNFRPVSNLFYISKLSEKAGAEQFMDHLTANDVHSHLQSAYEQQNSTETALLKVKNGILMSMNEKHVTLLVNRHKLLRGRYTVVCIIQPQSICGC